MGAPWGPPGSSWEPLGGLLGGSWGPLGASWGPLGGLLGPLGGLLGASWFLLGASRGRGLEMSVLVPRPGTLLEPSWGPLGPSWRRLGPSWGPLGPLWVPPGSLWGRLRAIWGASWAVLERREAEEARTPKSFKNRLEINDFSSWGPLGSAPGGFLGRLAGLLGRLEAVKASWTDRSAIRGPLGPSWGPLGAVLACLGAFLAPGPRGGNRI